MTKKILVSFRLLKELKARLDKVSKKIQAEVPASQRSSYTQTNIIQAGLERVLEHLEAHGKY